MADPFSLAADILDPPKTGVLVYHDDPAGFVRECILWKPNQKPARYQLENMAKLVEHHRLAVRGPRGLGKTSTHAWLILWFALTRDAAGEDWKAIATAGVFRQLKDYLWAEVDRKWAPRLDWERIGRKPFTQVEMMREELRLRFGSVTLAAATDPAKIEGAHADQLLYIFDESKSVAAETFDSAEGAFSGAGEDTEAEAFVIASSTPGAPEGRFYDIHHRAPGLTSWHPVHVQLEDVLREKRISRKWIEEREEQYGRDSAWFQNHALGEFASQEEDGVIRMDHLEAAHERWRELGLPHAMRTNREMAVPQFPTLEPLHAVGVDLARGGKDRTIYALRHANVISSLLLRPKESDAMVPAGEVKAIVDSAEHKPFAIVDAVGLGGPVVDRLREMGVNVRAFVANEAATGRSRDGIFPFVDCRAAAWWLLREMLEPGSGMELAIPPDDQLTADLLAPHWKVDSSARIRVESKDDIRKRLQRSTDAGDGVVQAFWSTRVARLAVAPFFTETPSESRWASLRPGTLIAG